MHRILLILLLLGAAGPVWAADQACAVCSVQQERYHLEDCPLQTEFQGQTFYFCEDACQKTFLADPTSWSSRFAALQTSLPSATSLPSFRFPLEPVGSLSSEDLAGKIVVLNLWATWCGPCAAEMPDLVKLQEQYADRGVAVVALSFDKTREAHRKGVQDLKLNFLSIYADQDAVQSFLEQLGDVSAIPVTFIVDGQGKIVERIDGKTEFAKLVQKIEPLLPRAEMPAPATDEPKQEARRGSVAPS